MIEGDPAYLGWMRNWFYNAAANWQFIKADVESGRDVDSISLRGRNRGPAIILGSGISLEKGLDRLYSWKGALFGSASQFKIADCADRPLDYLVIVDSGFENVAAIDGPKQVSTLLCNPTVNPGVLDIWKGRRKYMLPISTDEQFNLALAAKYPWLTGKAMNAGCVTNSEIMIAHSMGYGPLFMLGVDFAFGDDGKSRANNVFFKGQYQYNMLLPSYIDQSNPMVFKYKGRLTQRNQYLYMADMYNLPLVMDDPYVIDCSDGIITEIPQMDINDVYENWDNGKVKCILPHSFVCLGQSVFGEVPVPVPFSLEEPASHTYRRTWRVTLSLYIARDATLVILHGFRI